MTTSRNINFGTTELVKDMKNITVITSIEQVVQLYHGQGLRVQEILADGRLKNIQN